MKSQEILDDKPLRRGGKGFTLVELLIVVAFIVLFATAVIPSYSSLYTVGRVDESADEIIQSLRLARVRSISRVNNNWHGVYFSINPSGPDSYTLFQGNNASASYGNRISSFDLIYSVPSSIMISTTLPGNEIIFARSSGAPSLAASQSITLTHNSDDARVILLNTAGLIERQ